MGGKRNKDWKVKDKCGKRTNQRLHKCDTFFDYYIGFERREVRNFSWR